MGLDRVPEAKCLRKKSVRSYYRAVLNYDEIDKSKGIEVELLKNITEAIEKIVRG